MERMCVIVENRFEYIIDKSTERILFSVHILMVGKMYFIFKTLSRQLIHVKHKTISVSIFIQQNDFVLRNFPIFTCLLFRKKKTTNRSVRLL